MNIIIEILRGLVGLFVDDEMLAVGVLSVVGLTAFLVIIAGVDPLTAGAILLIGNLLVLIVGATRTARRNVR
jgi:hypothetical protein